MRTVLMSLAVLGLFAAGTPAGYTAVPDKASADLTKLVYTPAGSNWDVTSGPVAHILFAAKDAATGMYAAQATLELLATPMHREGFGLFIGGKDLTDPAKISYTYFVVASTGEYLVKVRMGDKTTTIVDWKASADVPKPGADGKATYALKIHVAGPVMHLYVNGKMIAEVPTTGAPTDGIAGLRINHNLHLMVTPLTIVK